MGIDPKGLHYLGIRFDFSNYFIVFHYAKGENIPSYEGFYKIDNAPCTFMCFWRDEDFKPNAPDVPPPWEPNIPLPKPEQAWCEK